MTGVAKWINVSHNMVCLVFGECKERGIPPHCLEATEEQRMLTDFGKQTVGEKKVGTITEHIAKLDELYRITKVPPFWERVSDTKKYLWLGSIGKLIKIRGSFGTLKLSDGTQRFVPFDCMDLITVFIPPINADISPINDEELMKKMVLKPRSTLKIIKGLVKMNRDFRLRAFLDKGILV